MAKIKLTIQHNNVIYEPPVKEGIKLEWERTGVPGKLTFTVIKTGKLNFTEGDPVCFYYDNKKVFKGYVFKKKRDREQHIEVTCYDQLRYLKNKYTYIFENKTATQIIKALCDDFKLSTGSFDDTKYVIPAIAEENKSAFDIVLDVLEDTLLNTGDMFVLYDDFGKLRVKNCANMVSTTLIMKDTAENFDYTSSIDDETYNQVILYYKKDDQIQQIYTAYSPTTINQWGTLRYFEEVKNPTIGQNKADSLLKLHNKKTRDLKVTGAFGDITIRGGTLIPVELKLGDATIKNYMLVTSVTHNFNNDTHTMDVTLEGGWKDEDYKVVSKTIGEIVEDTPATTTTVTETTPKQKYNKLLLFMFGDWEAMYDVELHYSKDGEVRSEAYNCKDYVLGYLTIEADKNDNVTFSVFCRSNPKQRINCTVKEVRMPTDKSENRLRKVDYNYYNVNLNKDVSLELTWVKATDWLKTGLLGSSGTFATDGDDFTTGDLGDIDA